MCFLRFIIVVTMTACLSKASEFSEKILKPEFQGVAKVCEKLLVEKLIVRDVEGAGSLGLYMPFKLTREAQNPHRSDRVNSHIIDITTTPTAEKVLSKYPSHEDGLSYVLGQLFSYAEEGYSPALIKLAGIFRYGELNVPKSNTIADVFNYANSIREGRERKPTPPEGLKPEELEALKKELIHKALEEALEEEAMKKASATQKKTRAKGGAVYHSISGATGKPPRRSFWQRLLGIGKTCSTPSHKKTV